MAKKQKIETTTKKDQEKIVENFLGIRKKKLNFQAYYKTKKQFYAVFLINQENTYNVIKRKKFDPEKRTIQFKKGNTHQVDISTPTYAKGLNLYYLIDVNEGQLQFSNHKAGSKVSPQLLDMILEQNIVKQLTANLAQKMLGGKVLSMLSSLLMGGLIGFIIGAFVI